MQTFLILFLCIYACSGRVRVLPDGEPDGKGGMTLQLRMPGIIPQKVLPTYICSIYFLFSCIFHGLTLAILG